MNDWDELNRDDDSGLPLGDAPPPAPTRENKSSALLPLAVAVVALAAVAIAGWWLLRRPDTPAPSPAPVDRVAEAAPPGKIGAPAPLGATDPSAEPFVVPALDTSDEAVRGLLSSVVAHPAFARWLGTDMMVRRFVAAVANVADGVHPRANLPITAPPGRFAVATAGVAVATPASYQRYEPWVDGFLAIDPHAAATAYGRLRPLFEEAYGDLGDTRRSFDETLTVAVAHLLATPVPAAPPELRPRVRSWAFADPRLEALSPAQKQLLRLGPENQRRVQDHLRRIAIALGVPAARLPG